MKNNYENKNESGDIKSLSETLPLLNIAQTDEEEDFSVEQENTFNEARGKILEQLGYTVKTNEDKYLSLEKNGYRIQVRHFILPSSRGFDRGRISAIEIGKEGNFLVWDARWVEKPRDEETKKIFEELVKYIN